MSGLWDEDASEAPWVRFVQRQDAKSRAIPSYLDEDAMWKREKEDREPPAEDSAEDGA